MDTKAIKESKEGKRSGEKATMCPEMAQEESGQHITYMYAQRAIPELIRHVAFRDYLRKTPGEARAYEQLKYQLAQRYRYDVDAYCEAKTNFVNSILEKAISETG